MLNPGFALSVAVGYLSLLFVIAFVTDRMAAKGRAGLISSPLVYTLSLTVYCTSWTFFGAVGSAARNGPEFATIYLGPTLVFVGSWFLLRKLVRISKAHRITSIADFISSRYGKSTRVAVVVTLIAVAGTTPYISLQLKAVATSLDALTIGRALLSPGGPSVFGDTAFWVAASMAAFVIIFGTRNIGADEHHPGVVAAIAFESLVKLAAFIAVGLYVVLGLRATGGAYDGMAWLDPALRQSPPFTGSDPARWTAMLFLAAAAIICLPRQFQVTVVEVTDERHLRTASWLFPLYMFLISLFTVPIAVAGLATLGPGGNPDLYRDDRADAGRAGLARARRLHRRPVLGDVDGDRRLHRALDHDLQPHRHADAAAEPRAASPREERPDRAAPHRPAGGDRGDPVAGLSLLPDQRALRRARRHRPHLLRRRGAVPAGDHRRHLLARRDREGRACRPSLRVRPLDLHAPHPEHRPRRLAGARASSTTGRSASPS